MTAFSATFAFIRQIRTQLQGRGGWGAVLVAAFLVGALPAGAAAEPRVAVSPAELVFSGVEGESCGAPQNVNVTSQTAGSAVSWQVTSDSPWLQVNASSGATPSQLTGFVDCTGLAPGIHHATLTVIDQGLVGDPVTVAAKLIINPASRVTLSTWKDGRRGAFSATTDDGRTSGFEVLAEHGLAGTFVMNGTYPPPEYFGIYATGMELGSHLVSHYCYDVDRATWRYEMEANIAGVMVATQSYDDVVSMVWPCGFTTLDAQTIAAEYFLSARGYNINQLEEPTPANFMNLKSFNSHEHEPYPPQDLKSIVDAAEAQGKWANLVLHDFTNDDGAIAYAATKDVWVAPIGTVVKYILQRDRTLITQYSETGSTISFAFSRLPLAPSVLRDFEATIHPADQITFRVDTTGLPLPYVASVTVSGDAVPFHVAMEGDSRLLYFSSPVNSIERAVEITLSGTPPSVLQVDAGSLTFAAAEGGSAASKTINVENSGGHWEATVSGSGLGWLSVTPPSGVGAGSIDVTVNPAGLYEGVYAGVITIVAPGAINSPRTVDVKLVVAPADAQNYAMNYPDRESLLAGGWDFQARSAGGASRNTEQSTGTTVIYDSSGALRIPADAGDLWGSLNDTRNSVFRNLPANWKSVRVLLDFAPTQNYQQAGLVVYGDDDNYVHIARAFNSWSMGSSITFAHEVAGVYEDLGAAPTTARTNIFLRLDRSSATGLISGLYSLDGGETWQPLGSVAQTISAPRLGLIVGASPGGFPVATFHAVQVLVEGVQSPTPALQLSTTNLSFSTSVGETVAPQTIGVTNEGTGTLEWTASISGSGSWLSVSPASGTGAGSISVSVNAAGLPAGTYTKTLTVTAPGAANSPRTVPVTLVVHPAASTGTYLFNYVDRASLLADGWDFLARTASGAIRNTEQTGQLTYSPSGLGIPAGPGDLWDDLNNTRNSLFRNLPSSWESVELSLTFAPTANYQQAGIVVYDNDDSYVQVTRNFNSWSGGQSVAFISEAGSSITDGASLTSATTMRLRLVRSGNLITGSYSTNGGSTWVQVGSASRAFATPRLGIIVGANDSGGTVPVATIQSVHVTQDSPPTTPVLKLNVTSLSFSMTAGASSPAPQTIGIANEGAGTLQWTASIGGTGSWLSVSPASGTGAGSVSVSVNAAGLSAGTYTQTVTVTAPGATNSPQTVPVTLVVSPEPVPVLQLSAASLGFATQAGTSPASQTIGITNGGTGTLQWTVTIGGTGSWLSVSPASGTGAGSVSVSVNAAGLSAGTYTKTLTVTAPGAASSPQTVPVTLVVSPEPTPVLQLSSASLGFATQAGTSPGPQAIGITNGGAGTLQWTVTIGGTGSWLSVNPASGTGTGSVSVSVNAAGLSAGTYTKTLTVTAPGAANSPQTVPVTLVVSPAGTGNATATYVFSYPNRTSLLADGWDFLAKTGGGATRNTEQSGQVTYSASGLGIPAGPGDLWDNLNNTRNSLFRDLPSSWESVELSLTFAPTANYQQAGIVVYDHDDSYVQVTRNFNSWSGGQSVAFVSESGSSISDSSSLTSATAMRLRLVRSGNLITGSYSTNGGSTWVQVGSASRAFSAPRLGIIVGANDAGGTPPVATVHEVKVTQDSPPTTPVLKLSATSLAFSTSSAETPVAPQTIGITNEGAGTLVWAASVSGSGSWLSVSPAEGAGAGTINVQVDAVGLSAGTYTQNLTVTAPGAENSPKVVPVTLTVSPTGAATYLFNYPNRTSLLADGWDFLAKTAGGATRNTEQTGQVTYSASGLGIPAGPGDLWDNLNNTRNSLFRDLPPTWSSVELSLTFAPTANYQQAGIVVYDNDDSYVQVTRNYNSWSGGQSVAFVSELGSSISDSASQTSATAMRLRLARSGSVIVGSYSVDGGTTWISVSSATRTFTAPRLGIIVGANDSGGTPPVATIHEVKVTNAP